MAPTAFTAKLSNGCSSSQLLVPEELEHSWLSVALPRVLDAEVSLTSGSSSSTCKGLVALLPLIFEKLLGKPLDASPWSGPVIQSSGTCQENALTVSVALAFKPMSQDGLFEVETPLGLVTIRLLGLRDTTERQVVPTEPASTCPEQRPLVLLDLPADWLEPAILRACWHCKDLEFIEESEDSKPLEPWHGWFSQWGKVEQLRLSTHCASEAERPALLAVCFADADDSRRCVEALAGGRLLCQKDPAARAIFAAVRLKPRKEYDDQVEAAWQEHLVLEGEISRIDQGLVKQELLDAVPPGVEACLKPLLDLLCNWLTSGVLHATSTVCAQRRLQEADPSKTKPAELFRVTCWQGLFKVSLQIQPTAMEEAETFAFALGEHWRKAHGVCLDMGQSDAIELSSVMQKVWASAGEAQAEMRRSAEEEALKAEKALMQELDEEKEQAKTKEQKRKGTKEKLKRRARSGSASSKDEKATDAGSEISEPTDYAQAQGDDVSQSTCSSRRASGTISQEKLPPRLPPSRKKKDRKHVSEALVQKESPARREPDIDAILEAVRKSEELHSRRASQVDQASAPAQQTSGDLRDSQREEDGNEPEVYVPPSQGTVRDDEASTVFPSTSSPPSTDPASEEAWEAASEGAPEVAQVRIASSVDGRSVVTWSDLGDAEMMGKTSNAEQSTLTQITPAITQFAAVPPPPAQPPVLKSSMQESLPAPPPTSPTSHGLLLATTPKAEATLPRATLRAPELDQATLTSEADVSPTASPSSQKGRKSRRRQKVTSPSAPTTPATIRSVVTLNDLGFDLGAPKTLPKSLHNTPAVTSPAAKQPAQSAEQHCFSPGASWTVAWQPNAWPHSPAPCASPMMASYPGPAWPQSGLDDARSLGQMMTGTGQQDHSETLKTWLHASGLTCSGADLAERLRAVAPDAYED